ncbi:MAG: hypothetical protein MSG64_19765 [Pyrinomonadaceae bacterium MAG19_C2-C3]|nr:hypothetical protein [Pyrinomonadaceae bacterium MAG19_C2-C3]
MPTVEQHNDFSSLDDGRTVTTRIFKDFVQKAAMTRGISDGRMHVIVHHHCPYPKTLALLGSLAPHNPAGVRELQAHFNAWIEYLLAPFESRESNPLSLHKECYEAVNATLAGGCTDTREREILQAIADLYRELACVHREREQVARAVEAGGVQ